MVSKLVVTDIVPQHLGAGHSCANSAWPGKRGPSVRYADQRTVFETFGRRILDSELSSGL